MRKAGMRIARVRRPIEWPTVALAGTIYGFWGVLTYFHTLFPLWLWIPLGAWTVAWHASLQHEIIHGHPTASRAVNRLVGCWPLLLWLPYESYRISHLVHHRDERLTDPLDDPESHYWTQEQWDRLGLLHALAVRANATFLGRITIGPARSIYCFVQREARLVWQGNAMHRRIWAGHALQLAVVLAWLVFACGLNPLLYFVAIVYPGTALMLVRSYAEHRAESEVDERTAIVENAPVLGLLFLYNNLHVVHHEQPTMPWYQIPAWYRAHRARLVRDNGGLVYDGYLDVARRYFLTAHDTLIHPLGRVPALDAERPETPAPALAGA
ncbi:fatty acid desaturase [Labrys monachus]|uniref:Fatty acid desaturase n=1 Tax=Labrys monachus TaxID=217067 RepID=A0ABU0FNP8_9HYPH|nr:fatty acid desaturase [Labrys monachus]MDQ0396156.1 fatty acid desaturase [Labrys monachus]